MMHTRDIVIVIIVLILLVFGIYWYNNLREAGVVNDSNRVVSETPNTETPPSKIKADVFTGKLEEVHPGCFVDGECYVVVNGKHVTTTMGWSQETVGQVLGVESFGDLEKHIGEEVEVYAQDKSDGTYTLYGSEGFYVKLK